MSALPKDPPLLTFEQYLDLPTADNVRHEFVNGQIFVLAEPTRTHARIVRNLLTALDRHLSAAQGPDAACEALAGVALRLEIMESEVGYVPDIAVVCDRRDRHPKYIERPKVLVEVLSPSTGNTDRREKYLAYRTLESLEEYVMVDQEELHVIVARREDGWKPHHIVGGGQLELRSLGLLMDVASIYRGSEGVSAAE